ncbi:MAG TPA: cytochrome c [Thermoanaerobaculia bacterium]|nr:cytochrome c [Thermoanaerobaculia bacterium]
MAKPGSNLRSALAAATAAVLLAGWAAPLFATDELPFYSVPGDRLFERTPSYPNDPDHFKYGSLGGERGYKGQVGFGLPYWIWVALPELFPEYLPDRKPGQGYASFGYIYEPGGDPRFQLPVGTSQRNSLALDRVWINCGVCHTGTVRETPQSERQIVLGMPANRYNQGEWVRFLFAAASDPRFNGEHLVRKIREMEKERRKVPKDKRAGPRLPKELNPLEEEIYRLAVVPVMRRRLLSIRERLDFIDLESWGPGRVDTFNAPKALLNFPMHLAPEKEKRGNSDLPSVWYQKGREGMQLHWDGNNTSVQERNLSASFAATIPPLIDKCNLRRVARIMETLAPPPFPAERIDKALAARGAPLYNAQCAGCHGASAPPFRRNGGVGKLVGTVVPLKAIKTDRWRLDSYTPELVRAQNSIYAEYPLRDSRECPDDPGAKGYPARFNHFRKTDGYASSPLDGIWLRAPYLHNGSVPNLRALLEPGENRPKKFWTGYDVYDYKNLGFVTEGPDAETEGWLYDTELPANGNQGHEYGTRLLPEEKDALIEYLKTF